MMQRVLLAGRAFWFYLGKLVWPVPLTFIYPRWHLDPGEAWQYLYPAAAVALIGVLAWAHTRLGWGPLVACLCYAITLFPALGFFDVYPFRYSFVADHFQYLACAAPLAVLAALGTWAAGRVSPAAGRLLARLLLGLSKDDPAVAPLGVVATGLLAGLLLATLGGLSFAQAWVYRDAVTLFQDTLAKNPEAWMAHNNLGSVFLTRKQFQEAEQHFRACLELKPDHRGARRGLARVLFSQGRTREARGELRVTLEALAARAREATTDREKHALAQEYVKIGVVEEGMGDKNEAERLFRVALEVSPDDALAHFHLGDALASRGRFADAVPHLRAAAEAEPRSADYHYFLAQALQGAGKKTEALATAQEALRLAEAEGNVSLKNALLKRFALR
jgi:tetratricopeptide (TPR) repeat protein